MDEAAGVEMGEPGSDPFRDAARLLRGQRLPGQALLERPVGQPLESHERAGLVLAVVEDAHDVLVRERRDRLRLPPEPLQVGGRREHLHGHGPVERVVVRAPDLRHRAAALQLFEPVAAGDLVSGVHDYGMPRVASLLTLEEAQERVLAVASPLPVELVPIAAAAGRVAAEDVRAQVDLPPFASSAMDGFAVHAADLPATLAIAGESAAGSPFEGRLERGTAVAISTGAVVPDGADAVVPVEIVVQHRQQSGVSRNGRGRRERPAARQRRGLRETSS